MRLPEPGPDNDYHASHILTLCFSYHHWTGTHLCDPQQPPGEAAMRLYHASYALVSHDTQADPVFDYANLAAQSLFEMDWETFTQLPSRLSAEAPLRQERQRLLETVARQGYSDDYRGIRISHSGRRFMIEKAVIWNVIGHDGKLLGQAAKLERWRFLEETQERRGEE